MTILDVLTQCLRPIAVEGRFAAGDWQRIGESMPLPLMGLVRQIESLRNTASAVEQFRIVDAETGAVAWLSPTQSSERDHPDPSAV